MGVINSDYKLSDKLDFIKGKFERCSDLVVREFGYKVDKNYKLAIVYIDGMNNKDVVSDTVLNNIMFIPKILDEETHVVDIKKYIQEKTIGITEVKELSEDDEIIKNMLIGETILLIDGVKESILLSSKGWPTRSISEPQTETVIRGPRDGFTETIRVNTALIRRRVRDTNLKLESFIIGERSKTDVVVMYVDEIVNTNALKEVKKRLDKIDIDIIQETGDIEQLIQDNKFTIYPQLQYTERPDVVVNALYEGRIAILVDNTPFVLLAPVVASSFLHSPEDMYEKWLISSCVRLLRCLALIFALTLPAFYIAITSYHPDMMPTDLTLYLAATRLGVPFPAFVEAFLIEITLEFLREAGIRLPRAIGSTIGIVGGLVIGQAAVQAGLVSPLKIIIVAITAISSFMIPSYNFSIAVRLSRFAFMIGAACLGLYGIILVGLVYLIHLVKLQSFGIYYLEPFISVANNTSDLKDSVVRFPKPFLKFRSSVYSQKKSRKCTDTRDEKISEGDDN